MQDEEPAREETLGAEHDPTSADGEDRQSLLDRQQVDSLPLEDRDVVLADGEALLPPTEVTIKASYGDPLTLKPPTTTDPAADAPADTPDPPAADAPPTTELMIPEQEQEIPPPATAEEEESRSPAAPEEPRKSGLLELLKRRGPVSFYPEELGLDPKDVLCLLPKFYSSSRPKLRIKVGDFGISATVPEDVSHISDCNERGTLIYMAPEVYCG